MTTPYEHSPTEYRQTRFHTPDGATRLLLIRHGESAPARDGITFPLVDGQSDPNLAPEGMEHAERLARRLRAEHLDGIYVTPLRRTAQTAAPLAGELNITPAMEPDLREIYLGQWEGGLLRKHVAERHPIALRMRAEQRWDVIPGAESMEALTARVRDAVTRIATRHPDERLAVFSHGGVIATLLALASRSEPFAFESVDNGSISEVVVAGTSWTVRRFNDTAHLDATA